MKSISFFNAKWRRFIYLWGNWFIVEEDYGPYLDGRQVLGEKPLNLIAH